MIFNRLRRATILLAAAALVRAAPAEPLQWEVATPFPEAGKAHAALVKAGKRLARSTDGRIRVRFRGFDPHPDLSMLEILRRDEDLDAALVPYTEMSALNPDAGLYGQFFLFSGFSEVNAVRRLLDHVFLSEAQSDNYVVIGVLGLGFVHLMSAEHFIAVQELSGQAVLIPSYSSVYAGLFNAIDLTLQTETRDEPPSLILTNTSALILDDSIPRLEYIVSPPVHYIYLLLVTKRSRWAALPASSASAIERLFMEELGKLERDAERAAERASRVLARRGMRELHLDSNDVPALRDAGADGRISPPLQSELRDTLSRLRR